MRSVAALTLVLALMLGGCGMHKRPAAQTPAPTAPADVLQTPVTELSTLATTQPTEPPTEAPTTEAPTEPPVYFNPLNGTILDEPYTGRIYASTISNISYALPHVGTNQADILMESFVNGSVVRCIALFTDISKLESIGSTRSTRPMFNDIVQHYDAILLHAGGSSQALHDARTRGIDNFNVEIWSWRDLCSFRDSEREKELGYEHSLMVKGAGAVENAVNQGMRQEQSPDKDYFLRFTEDGTPADGSPASTVTITLTYNTSQKESIMVYDSALGKYVFNQYSQANIDGATGEPEAFRNVIVMLANITMSSGYQVADFESGGTGYFACGGKLVPITWSCDGQASPFRFFGPDGKPLQLGMGNTYIAITQPQSSIVYE